MATTDGTIKLNAEISTDTTDLKRLFKDIQYMQKILDKLDEKPIELISDSEMEKIYKLNRAVSDLSLEILDKSGALKEFGFKTTDFEDIYAASDKFAELGYNLEDVFDTIYAGINQDTDAIDNMGNTTQSVLPIFTNLRRLIGDGIGSSFSQLAGITKGLGTKIKGIFANVVKGANRGAMSMKRMLMAMVGARSLFTVISKATHQYMARNEELNQKLQSMWSMLGQLVGPIIEYIVNLIIKLMGYFLSFIKLLGVNTKALKEQAKASNKAAKGQERQLAAFDEMNKLSDSGGDDNKFFDIPEIDFGNLEDIGKTIAEKINELLFAVDWEKLQLKVHHIMEQILDNINEFIYTLNWERLGWNIAQGFNTALVVLYDIVTQFDFFALAKRLSDAFVTMVNNINWTKVVQTIIIGISNLLTAIWIFIGNTVKNIKWDSIAQKIEYGLATINWKEVLGGLAVSFLNALVALLEFNFLRVPQLILSVIIGVFKAMGQDSIAGFFEGISELLVNLGTWIREHIFDPFINWIKTLFGIHSPSTVMAAIGVDVMQGLLNGISSLVGKVKEIWQNLKDNIVNTWNSVKNWVVNVADTMKSALIDKFTNAKNTVVGVWNGLKDSVVGIFTNLWNGLKSVINSIIGGVERMANGVIDGINTVIRALNRLQFNIPSWVPVYGGNSFGFNISQLGRVYIPRLAQGAVIPPNREFMAVLGDQTSGTNIEAPLDTIVEAFRQVQGEGYDRPIVVQLVCDSKVLAKAVANGQRKLDLSFNR